MNKQHVLSNGVVVEESTRKSNRTGYNGAALSTAWTLDADRPFIAACGNPSDPEVMKHMSAQDRTSWHGGHYADAREAAYVVGLFKRDPINTERTVRTEGVISDFPADLYALPEGLPIADAVDYLTKKKLDKKAKSKKGEVTIKLDTNTPARGYLSKVYSIESIREAAKKAGGPEAFQAALEGVNVVEAAVKFNLKVKE